MPMVEQYPIRNFDINTQLAKQSSDRGMESTEYDSINGIQRSDVCENVNTENKVKWCWFLYI